MQHKNSFHIITHLRNQKVRYYMNKSSSLVPVLSQTNPVHTLPYDFLMIQFMKKETTTQNEQIITINTLHVVKLLHKNLLAMNTRLVLH
jgi:hypothetical protein